MEGISLDLNTIPIGNLIAISVCVIAIIFIVALIIKKLGISVGSIKPDVYEYDQFCQTEMYHLQEKIADLDQETKIAMRRYTKFGAYSIAKIANLDNVCSAIRSSLIYSMKEPLLTFVSENHFTKELTESGYDSYRTKIISAIRDTYYDIVCDAKQMHCDVTLPAWEDAKDAYIELIDSWLYMAVKEVLKTCKRKLLEYEKIIKIVGKNKNWKAVVENCMEKNEKYISFLEQKSQLLSQKIKRNLCYE